MSNTSDLFKTMKQYTEARSAAREEYLRAMKPYDEDRGSAFYRRKQDEAMKRRNAALDAAQAECANGIDAAIRRMREHAGSRRMAAPTEEQLRLLSLLKLRDRLTRSELDAAANSMDGNAAALALLAEMARKNGDLGGGRYLAMASGGLNGEEASAAVDNIAAACRKILANRSGANHNRLMGAQRNYKLHNVSFDADSLPQEAALTTEQDFYDGISSVPFDVLMQTVG